MLSYSGLRVFTAKGYKTQLTKGKGVCGGVQGKPGTSFQNRVAGDTFDSACSRLLSTSTRRSLDLCPSLGLWCQGLLRVPQG